MRLYDCKVLLAGSRDNEVRKTDVTAAEIMILRSFHGTDSVLEVVPKAMDKRTHSDERKRLFSVYVGAAETDNLGDGFQGQRAKVLQSLFGPAHNQLPVELPEAESFVDEADAPAPSRVKIPAKSGKAEDIAAAAALA